jgi:D-alanine-D-alanine ligase
MGAGRKSPGIVVLYNATDGLIKGEPKDLLAEQGVVHCAEAVSDALNSAGYRVAQVPVHTDVELALAGYPPTEWMIFNLGEGLAGRLFEEPRIVWALEAMGYCFTGSDGNAIACSVHKGRAKTLLSRAGVLTPPWWLFRHPDEVDSLGDHLRFPLIVKPVAEDASIGVGADAVVDGVSALRDRVAYIIERYRQAALVEVFVVGREFNVSLWGDPPDVLPLAEIDFSAFDDPYSRIVSFAAKWEEESFEYHHTPVICPAPTSGGCSDCIADVARRAWHVIGCRGYARVDMRLGDGDVPYVVEVNCNPDLSPEAGFHQAARVAGYSYEGMVANIVEVARRRHGVDDRLEGHARRNTSLRGLLGAEKSNDRRDGRGGADVAGQWCPQGWETPRKMASGELEPGALDCSVPSAPLKRRR